MLDSPDPTPQQIRSGRAAKQKMITSNLRLAAKCAFGFRRRIQAAGGDMADAMQEAVIGLNRAVEKFDHTRGYKFSTYATLWCNQAVRRYIETSTSMVRPPINAQVTCRRWRYRPTGQTADEFCQEWGLTREKLEQELHHAARASCLNLDAPLNSAEGNTWLETVAAPSGEPCLDGLDLEMAVSRLEAVLPEETALVARWAGGQSRREIALTEGISHQGAGHRLEVARRKLRAVAGLDALALLEGVA